MSVCFDAAVVGEKIKNVLDDTNSGVKIVEVRVEDDVDFDGDSILRVNVIFDGKVKDIKPSFTSSAIRIIRPKLFDMKIFEFPMMSFISVKDAKFAAR